MIRTSVALTLCTVVLLAIAGGREIVALQHRVTVLEHACIPVDTGGGVTQCAQPNTLQTGTR